MRLQLERISQPRRVVSLGLAMAPLLFTGCDTGGLDVAQPRAPDAAAGSTGGASESSGGGVPPGLDSSGSSGSPVEPVPEGESPRTLVPLDATWRVSATAPEGWTDPGFDDSAWSDVVAPLGRGYPDVTPWPEAGTIFARVAFEAELTAGEPLELRIQRDDAARAYLDGAPVGSWNVLGEGADDEVTGVEGYGFFVAQWPAPAGREHVLAVELLQGADPDAVLSARLRRVAAGQGRTDVVVQLRSRSRDGKYAPDNVGAVWIERADGSFVRTLGVWAGTRREHLLQWNARTAANMVDAQTSATAGAHHARLYTWDLTDASGAAVAPGSFVLRAEFTEDNSNEGAAVGPTLSVPFSTSENCHVATADEAYFADVTIVGPCS